MPRTRAAPQETHPLVRPAPPVQERTPQQEQQQEQKFNNGTSSGPARACGTTEAELAASGTGTCAERGEAGEEVSRGV